MPKPYLVPAIKRGFQIIEYLAESGGGLTISDIHRALKLPLSSAATILYTLESLGYLERNDEDGRYALSMKLFGLSRDMDQADLVGRCHDLLEKLVSESGLTGHLAVLRDGNSMYVDRVPSPGLMQVSSYIGMTWPAHASGVGKALLAFLDVEELRAKLGSFELKKLTPETIVSQAYIEKQFAKFRNLGYAWESNEGEIGVGCVAAPVFGPGLRVVAAASITGTASQITRSSIPNLGRLVKKYTTQMSKRLGANL
jgi:IclR family transcriptional regulator, KDG regulon repressor